MKNKRVLDEWKNIEKKHNIYFPKEYTECYLNSQNLDSFIGENSYLVLIPIEELEEDNKGFQIQESYPDFYLFAGNGGGAGYCFDSNGHFYEIDYCSSFIENAIKCGENWEEFIKYLLNY